MQYSLMFKTCNGNVEDVRALQRNEVTANTTLDRHVLQLELFSFILLARSKGLIGNQCLVKHIACNMRRR